MPEYIIGCLHASIIKELLGTKMAEFNEILTNAKYGSSDYSFSKELGSISGS